MTEEARIPDIYGPGTHTDRTFTPVPEDAARILGLLASQTPVFFTSTNNLSKAHFTGESYPVLPGAIKAIPVAAALHAMLGLVADEILSLRSSSLSPSDRQIEINTTHAALWLATAGLVYLDGESLPSLRGKLAPGTIPDWERGWHSTPLKLRGTGIYPTRVKGEWYSLHGSLDVPPMLRSLGIDPDDQDIKTNDEAARHIEGFTRRYSSAELEMHMLYHGFCGSICFTPQGWRESSMGRALGSRPLVDVRMVRDGMTENTPAVPFTSFSGEDRRPLVGVRVVEMTRVIAGPQIGVLLAALGADVVRVHAPHLPDVNTMQLTLNAGKRTVGLDLRVGADREYLMGLVEQADVFIQGFRPGVLARSHGLGVEDLVEIAARRGKGIVYVSESCYGPEGYYAQRPGWQQIADCASGAAYVTGRALGLPDGECVLPPLPISDMSTGMVGAVGTLLALRDRAVKGGSYEVHASLVKVNMFMLSEEVGLYPTQVVEEGRKRFGWGEMRGAHHVLDLLRVVWTGWTGTEPIKRYLAEDGGWFQSWEKSAFGGKKLSILKPVVRFERDGEEEEQTTPRWTSASVPYALWKKEDVAFA
ncbi:succinate--hydroxymethylglutarate CoA-transferase [Echria macrotheca]|uniref:Succinate--hydroxymethylglutarate CoA-transferase n=1 Tax=Echria macrotheca TaxID=438768 RepID=A0AAJ0B7P0_9PEZI|nr:succinate--hydroxymethylglutarate CoA-transferase [Echria macrotheca]